MHVLILDGNNFAIRAFGAAPLIYESQRTEVIHVGLGMIKKCMADFDPDRIVIVWDGGRDIRRTSVYPAYKRPASREKMTEAEKQNWLICFRQMDVLRDSVLPKLGLTQYRLYHREADDVIAEIAKHHAHRGCDVTVVSTDKDMYQLMNTSPLIRIYSPIKDRIADAAWVRETMGVYPWLLLVYRAMVGDASDNLPGVKGIGPKKAVRLIDLLFGRDEHNHEEMTEQDKKLLALFESNMSEFELMKSLMEMKPIPADEILRGRIARSVWDGESVLQLLYKFGMSRHIDDFGRLSGLFESYFQREAANEDADMC